MVNETIIAPHIAQQNEKDDNDEDHALGEITQDSVGRVMHQIVAVEIRDNLYSGWKYVIIEPLDHGVDGFQHGRSVRTFAEEDNSFDYVVIILNNSVGAMVGLRICPAGESSVLA